MTGNELVALLEDQVGNQERELESLRAANLSLRVLLREATREHERKVAILEKRLRDAEARHAHALEAERTNVKTTYHAPKKVHDMIRSLPLVVGAVRFCTTGDGDQLDLEGALKRLEQWEEGFKRALHEPE